MYQTIICAITEPQSAPALVRKALLLAGNQPQRLHLLQICEHPLSGAGEVTHTDVTESEIMQHSLRALQELGHETGVPTQQIQVVFGDAADQIHACAAQRHADLVVVSAAPPSFWQTLTACPDKLLRSNDCDLLTVHNPLPPISE